MGESVLEVVSQPGSKQHFICLFVCQIHNFLTIGNRYETPNLQKILSAPTNELVGDQINKCEV